MNPSKIVGIGSNYRRHIEEMGRPVPTVPKVFLKPPSAIIGDGDAIQIPPGTDRVDHEAELGIVIGRRMTRVSAADALGFVGGYTAVNDVTARDFQRLDGVFSRAKGFDTFCPVGPRVVTSLDPSDLRIRCFVDGKLRQDGRTSDMIFDVPTILSFVSHIMTLEPGDLVATGTPMGVGPIVPGQTVVVDVEGVGELRNPVVARSDRVAR
ncbi:MAG: fumarylacetoacetate hydrolase family protein [Myxococcota bacterium]|nr:fumarylacetoacetate hydrolase family protein [Myxococcota bacterium]